jgi:ketosteroid isomerase-like protein
MRCYAVLIFVTLAVATLSPSVYGQRTEKGGVDRIRLQQQLSDIEQQWMAAERERKLDFLKDLWTDDFFDVLYDGRVATKDDMLKLFASTPARPGAGAFPDHFQLRSVFGNTAIATDHTVIKTPGSPDREFNCVRMFTKQNGKWKVAGSVISPATQATR